MLQVPEWMRPAVPAEVTVTHGIEGWGVLDITGGKKEESMSEWVHEWRCPKCGRKNEEPSWWAADHDHPQHLSFRCGACGYGWTAKPLDAVEGSSTAAPTVTQGTALRPPVDAGDRPEWMLTDEELAKATCSRRAQAKKIAEWLGIQSPGWAEIRRQYQLLKDVGLE